MRLVCPQCAAQYEVDINAIPEDGRDVQCANCGNTWFQDREPHTHAPDVPPISPEPAPEPDEFLGDEEPDAEEDEAQAPNPHERPQAAPVDQSVLDILRQEAELDATARQAVEPDDTSLEDTEEEVEEETDNLALRARAARSRLTASRDQERRLHLSTGDDEHADDETMAPPTEYTPQDLSPSYDEFEPDDQADTQYAPAPQREPTQERQPRELPDADALNSTLRSADDKSRETERKAKSGKKQKSGNRGISLGFYFAVLIFLILLAAYALKPQIIAAVPEAAPFLEQYTDLVDILRHRLLDGVTALIKAAQNLLAQYL
jgi:predicted Zn finger-like uncharacterized protein